MQVTRGAHSVLTTGPSATDDQKQVSASQSPAYRHVASQPHTGRAGTLRDWGKEKETLTEHLLCNRRYRYMNRLQLPDIVILKELMVQ